MTSDFGVRSNSKIHVRKLFEVNRSIVEMHLTTVLGREGKEARTREGEEGGDKIVNLLCERINEKA